LKAESKRRHWGSASLTGQWDTSCTLSLSGQYGGSLCELILRRNGSERKRINIDE
jgi:hypothetical protein